MADVIKFELAKSNRSKCRATGETIEKGEPRVGMEAWLSGRVSLTWQKVLPFLEACSVGYCSGNKSNFGTCKVSSAKFKKGDVRFTCCSLDKKTYLTLEAAAQQLAPVLAADAANTFTPLHFKGLDTLTESDREEFCKHFGVSQADARKFNRAHLPPAEPPSSAPPAKRRKKETGAADVPAAAQDADAGNAQPKGKAARKRKDAAAMDAAREKQEGKRVGGRHDADAIEPQQADDHAADQPEDKEDESAEELKPDVAASKQDDDQEGLSEYERQRMQQIARNRERLMALKLPGLAAQVMPPQPIQAHKVRGIASRKPKVKADTGPRRVSLRNQGISADGVMIHDEKRNGELVLVNGEAVRYKATQEAPEPRDRHPKDAVPFQSLHAAPASDAAFLQQLQRTLSGHDASTSALTAAKGHGKAKASAAGPAAVAQLRKLKLDPVDVAKVNTNGIVHLAFHPASDALIIASGDKSGHVGLWNVDYRPETRAAAFVEAGQTAVRKGKGTATEEADGEDDDDGVLEFEPHYSYICGLRWAGGCGSAAKLFTASYDGSVRMLDPGPGAYELVLSSDDAEFSAFDCLADGNTGFVGDKDGNLDVFDVRARKLAHEGVNIHDKKINTLHVEPSEERLIVTGSGDNSLCLWDVRKLGKGMKALSSARHPQTCLSAFFAPDGSQRVLSTSRDNTLAIWEGRTGMSQSVRISHNNNTGRWVVPFRATWGPAADCLVVGNMKRTVDIFSASGSQEAALSSEYMTAITSRNVFHPQLPILAAGSASGRMHIYR